MIFKKNDDNKIGICQMEILPNELIVHIFNQINIFDLLQSDLFLISKHFYNLTIGIFQNMKYNIIILKNLLNINNIRLYNLTYSSNYIIFDSKIGQFEYFKSIFSKNKVIIETFINNYGIGIVDFCSFQYYPKVKLKFGLSPFDDVSYIRMRINITDYHIECQDSCKKSKNFNKIISMSQLLQHGMVFLQCKNIF
jgi:hypothetical protein